MPNQREFFFARKIPRQCIQVRRQRLSFVETEIIRFVGQSGPKPIDRDHAILVPKCFHLIVEGEPE